MLDTEKGVLSWVVKKFFVDSTENIQLSDARVSDPAIIRFLRFSLGIWRASGYGLWPETNYGCALLLLAGAPLDKDGVL